MDNQELLTQVAGLLQQHTETTKSYIDECVGGFEDRISERMGGLEDRIGGLEARIDGIDKRIDGIDKRIDGIEERMDGLEERIDGSEKRIILLIENDVAKRIDALVDGYQLTHDKQWQQQRKIETMQAQIDEVQLRVLALESKGA